MRLVCPNCKANYEIPRHAVPIGGREVKCASCGHSWFQTRTKKSNDIQLIDPENKIIVFVGGVIPEQDYDFLYEKNISAIFGPGSNIIESAEKVIDLISDKNNQ